MKISILLPYKENFSPLYPGAVSLFINSMNKLSIFKKEFDLIGSIVENNWNNKKDLELRVIDIIQKT